MRVINLENVSPINMRELPTVGDHLEFVSNILDSCRLDWYLGFGCALGLYREKDFIPGDSDFDICILTNERTDIKRIRADLETRLRLARIVDDKDTIHQLAFLTHDGLIVDLCFFYKVGENWESLCEGGFWRDPVHIIGKPTKRETKYGLLPLPEKWEEYLELRYGDWQTPRYGSLSSSIKCE